MSGRTVSFFLGIATLPWLVTIEPAHHGMECTDTWNTYPSVRLRPDEAWDQNARLCCKLYYPTRRTWDEKNYGKLSNDDIAFINEDKERFGGPELENLYRGWGGGEITENAVRSDSIKLRTFGA
jgi:hypothetical protein